MQRILSLAAAAALGLALLTGCGDDGGGAASDGGDYCQDLKAAKENLDKIEGGDLGSLEDTTEQIHDLRDEAPDEIKDDWEILSDAFDQILAAFEEAGLDKEELAALQEGSKLPEDVDMAALQEALAELETLSRGEFEKAGDNIAKHAKEECDLDLEA